MKKTLTSLFLLLLLSASCEKKNAEIIPEDFFLKLLDSLASLKSIDKSYVNLGEIKEPQGIPIVILDGLFSDQEKNLNQRLCLYYQTPFRNKGGKLWFRYLETRFSCSDIENTDFTLLDLDKLEIKFNQGYKNDILIFTFEHHKMPQTFSIPLISLKKMRPFTYASPIKKDAVSPNLWIRLRTLKNPMDLRIGNINDSFILGSAKKCRKINNKCEIVGEDLCDQCRFGWYEVVDYNCPQGGSRFCGQNNCGKKDEPACPAGAKIFDLENSELCFDESPAGFCQEDLQIVCSKDHILTCR